MEELSTDVLVIGAGTAGSAAACALSRTSLDVTVIDKTETLGDTARGDHLQPRSCEILERWGVLGNLFANGAEKRTGSAWYDSGGDLLLESRVSTLDIPHPYFAFINHELIAKTLLEHAIQNGVRVTRPIRNWWLESTDANGFAIRVGQVQGGEVLLRSKLIVGADGRASRVRKVFDLPATTERYKRPIAVYFADSGDSADSGLLRAYLGNERTVAVIPRTGRRWKIGVPLTTQETNEWRTAPIGEIERRLSASTTGIRFENLAFADIYPPIHLQAKQWVNGRVVLVGDACHAMHPARSQGMNVAIRCVDELANRLAACAGGVADAPEALAKYESSLKPEIDAILESNHQSGLQMDRQSPQSTIEFCNFLRSIQADSDALHRYTMQAAGYPA